MNDGTWLKHVHLNARSKHYGSVGHNPARRRESGIDWLTMTHSHEWGLLGTHWATKVMEGIGSDEKGIRKTATLQGYTGVQVGKLFVGEHPHQGWLVQATGTKANEAIKYFNPDRCNCSRIDTQFTVWLKRPINKYFWRKLPKRVVKASSERKGKPTSYHEIVSSDGGRTFYIGSNSSDVQAKIYNKFVEQKRDEAWKYAYRFEVRWRGEYAARTAQKIQATTEDVQHLEALRNTSARFLRYGITLPYMPIEANEVDKAIDRTKSDIASKLQWLETQVRPTVRYLAKQIPMFELLHALGLEALATFEDCENVIIAAPVRELKG